MENPGYAIYNIQVIDLQELKYTEADMKKQKRDAYLAAQGMLIEKDKEWCKKEKEWSAKVNELNKALQQYKKEAQKKE